MNLAAKFKALEAKFEKITRDKYHPADDSFRAMREAELRIAAGVGYGLSKRSLRRHEFVHGANVQGDLYTIEEAEKENTPNVDILKKGNYNLYGANYENVKRLLQRIPKKLLIMVLNIHWNVLCHLNEWKAWGPYKC
jgi:hypothetical protein